MEKTCRLIDRTATIAVSLLMLVFTAFLSIVSFISTSYMTNAGTEVVTYLKDNVVVNILVSAFLFAIFYILFPYLLKIPLRWIKWGLFCVVLVIGIFWITGAKVLPFADTTYVNSAAYMFSKNRYNFIFEKGATYVGTYLEYFQHFPYQMGYILYNEILFRIFNFKASGSFSIIFLEYANLFYIAGIYLFLIDIIKQLFDNEKIAKVTAVMLFLCPQLLIYCTHIYSMIPGLFYSLLSIQLLLKYLKNEKIVFAIISMFCISIASTLKLNYLIFMIAICIVLAFKLFSLVSEKKIKKIIVLGGYIIFAVILSFSLIKLVVSSYEHRLGEKIGKGIPMISWMVMGLTNSGSNPGGYDANNINIYNIAEKNYDKAVEISKTIIKECFNRFKKNSKIRRDFFYQKTICQWNETTYQSLWRNQVGGTSLNGQGLAKFVCVTSEKQSKAYIDYISQFIFIMVLICTIWFLISYKKRNIVETVFFIIIIGGFLYHLLFEAKSQYILPYFILLIPLAALGFYQAYEFIENKLGINKKLTKKRGEKTL